jgi:hypothetical protein
VENLTLNGVHNAGGAVVSVVGGSLEMRQDSLITGNYHVYYSTYTISGAGGGVRVDSSGTFTMKDNASVSGNTACNGGGVCVLSGTFIMEDDALISNNTTLPYNSSSSNGGGVYVHSGTFIKKGGTIYGDTDTTHTAGRTENTATRGNGHAIYLYGDTKRNSTVDPTVNLYAQSGGGIFTFNDTSPGGVRDTTANWE